jgi:hypothetical protein
VHNVLINLSESLPKYLTDGKVVVLDDLLRMKLSVKSVGEEIKENLTTKHVKEVRVNISGNRDLIEKVRKATFTLDK